MPYNDKPQQHLIHFPLFGIKKKKYSINFKQVNYLVVCPCLTSNLKLMCVMKRKK